MPIRPIRPALAIGPTFCLHDPPIRLSPYTLSAHSCNPAAPIRPIRSAPVRLGPPARSAIRAIRSHPSAYTPEPIHLFRPAVAIDPTICLHDPPSASARSPISPFVQSGRTHPPIRLPDPTGRSDHPPDPPVAARTHPFASALAYPSVPARGGLDGFLHNRTPKPSVSYPPDPVSTPPPQPVALSAHSYNRSAPIRPIRLPDPTGRSARSPVSASTHPFASALAYLHAPTRSGQRWRFVGWFVCTACPPFGTRNRQGHREKAFVLPRNRTTRADNRIPTYPARLSACPFQQRAGLNRQAGDGMKKPEVPGRGETPPGKSFSSGIRSRAARRLPGKEMLRIKRNKHRFSYRYPKTVPRAGAKRAGQEFR